jgi:hypothetical protein
MGLYLITYDLRAPGRNYDALYRLLGTTWKGKKLAESVWVAALKGPASAVRDIIKTAVDRNDRIVVIELNGQFDWASIHAFAGGVQLLRAYSP